MRRQHLKFAANHNYVGAAVKQVDYRWVAASRGLVIAVMIGVYAAHPVREQAKLRWMASFLDGVEVGKNQQASIVSRGNELIPGVLRQNRRKGKQKKKKSLVSNW